MTRGNRGIIGPKTVNDEEPPGRCLVEANPSGISPSDFNEDLLQALSPSWPPHDTLIKPRLGLSINEGCQTGVEITKVKRKQRVTLKIQGGQLDQASAVKIFLTFHSSTFSGEVVQMPQEKMDDGTALDRKRHTMRVFWNNAISYGMDDCGHLFVEVLVSNNDGTVQLPIEFLAVSSDGHGKMKLAGGWQMNCVLLDAMGGNELERATMRMKCLAEVRKAKMKREMPSYDEPPVSLGNHKLDRYLVEVLQCSQAKKAKLEEEFRQKRARLEKEKEEKRAELELEENNQIERALRLASALNGPGL